MYSSTLALFHRYAAMAKKTYDIFIYLVIHLLKCIECFNLINYQRIFLFITCSLYTMPQVVHCTKMFFPGIVY